MRKNRILLALATILLAVLTAGAQSPAVTSAESPDLAEFQKIEDAWSAAINQRDQYGMELALSPLFVDVSSSGAITTRNQQIAQLVAGEDKALRYDQHAVTVRKLGDLAVVNGTYAIRRKAENGPVEERGVFTHVFQRQHGKWACLNSQRTAVREEAAAKTKKQNSGESSRLPLFGRGDKNDKGNKSDKGRE